MFREYSFRPNVEVIEAREPCGHYFICVDANQRNYFWSFRRLRLVGFDEGFIADEGFSTDREQACEQARRLAGSPSGALH